eukprot:3288906-Pleurochrysis_carterae.AAC.1
MDTHQMPDQFPGGVDALSEVCKMTRLETGQQHAAAAYNTQVAYIGRSDSPCMGDRTVNRSDRQRRCR